MAETIQKIVRFVVNSTEGTATTFEDEGANMERTTRTVAAAKTGTLTTRTDDNTGTITLDAGHGLSTGTFDIFWTGGSQRKVTCTITINACAIDAGTGDDLPVTSTAMTIMAPVSTDVDLDGDAVTALAVYGQRGGYVAFLDAADADIKVYGPLATNGADGFSTDAGDTNPLAGETVAKITFSHGSTSSGEMRSRAVYGTP